MRKWAEVQRGHWCVRNRKCKRTLAIPLQEKYHLQLPEYPGVVECVKIS